MMDKLGEAIKVCLWLALIAFIFGWLMNTQAHASSPQLDALATEVVGSPVTVECFEPNPRYEGYVLMVSSAPDFTWQPQPIIHLDGRDCGALQNVLTPGPRTQRWLRTVNGAQFVGQAMHALTHEAYHIQLASSDEGRVECHTYRNDYRNVKLLHLPWKITRMVYQGAENTHLSMSRTGIHAAYRSVC